MAEELPSVIDVRPLLTQAAALEGTIATARLARITAPMRACAPAELTLQADGDTTPGPRLRGTMNATIATQCQRCLEEVRITLSSNFDLLIIDAAAEPEAALEEDIVIARDDRIDIVALAEDEIMLACPMIPVHDDASCHAADATRGSADTKRPFANLAALMAEKSREDDT